LRFSNIFNKNKLYHGKGLSLVQMYISDKCKVYHAAQESVGGHSSPCSRPAAPSWRTTYVCDLQPVQCQSYGYLPSRQASLPIGWYQIILLGDRGTCVNKLPRVALDRGVAGIRTRNLLIASLAPYHYATEPYFSDTQLKICHLRY